MIRTIMASPTIITLICISPLPNIAEALEREPAIAQKCRFVGMHGSIYSGYGKNHPIPECNIVNEIDAAKKVFSAPWHEMIITPTDSCEKVVLSGEDYQLLLHSDEPLVRATIENYRIWSQCADHRKNAFPHKSTSLFDTVAIYLAFSTELLVIENMGIRISDEGFTVPDPTAKFIRVAIDWKDLPAFEKFLVHRLLRPESASV